MALVAAQAPDADPLVSFMLFIPVLKFLILLSLTLSQLSGVLWNNMHVFEQRNYAEKGKHCILVSLRALFPAF